MPGDSVTELLLAWGSGDRGALDKLLPVVYDELRRIAHRQMVREQPGHGLQTTALIHEAYMRLVDVNRMAFSDRAHFLAACAQIMRRILIDIARSEHRLKRGGDVHSLNLDEAAIVGDRNNGDFAALEEALLALSKVDSRKAQVVEMRFYAGMTAEETSVVLRVSPDTVQRDWKFAKVWLLRELDRRGIRAARSMGQHH
jgi:RNA polymerase sigma factor (TIGR02999 family)